MFGASATGNVAAAICGSVAFAVGVWEYHYEKTHAMPVSSDEKKDG